MKSVFKKVWMTIAAGLFTLALLFGVLSLPTAPANAAAALSVQKTTFVEGEAINVTAYGSGTDWVGIYREGETLSARWYWIAENGEAGAVAGSGVTVDITSFGSNNSSSNISATISAGNYTIYLIRNNGAYTSAEIAIPIVVKEATPLYVEQTEFELKSPIYVTATHSDPGAWVGLYRTTESSYCRWYWVSSANGVPFDITQGEKNIETSFSPNVMRGDYFLRLHDSGNNVLSQLPISVIADPTIPSSPLAATYTLANNTDGYATGTVSVTMPTNDLTDRCIALFWGDDNGIFEDYSYIKFHVTGEVSTFTFGKNVIIPYGATKLYVFAKNTNGDALSTGCVTVDLPQGAARKNPMATDGKSFWVISDLHIDEDPNHVHNQHFVGAMQDIARIDGDAMSLIINGDMTSRGREGDWSNFKSLCDNATGIPPIVLAMGNHEYYNGSYEYINSKFFELAKYPDGSYVNKLHYDYWQGDYHFVFLGTDTWPQNNTHAVLSQETLTWLDATLDQGKDEHKPTFLFLHQPLYDTVAGSRPGEDYSGVEANSEAALRTILADHPEVMLFVGHTHWTMNAEANMYEGTDSLPTRMFNTSSAGYLWTTYDNASGDYLYGSEGYYIRVEGGTLYVMGYDFVADQWISAAQYCIELDPASAEHTCADNDNNHLCDECFTPLSTCADNTNDHKCDVCGTVLTTCKDNNNNHYCDICNTFLTTCKDSNNDHLCDTCNERLSNCLDKNNNHYCNVCNAKLTDCVDENENHKCDCCHADMGEHEQADGKYVCEYCKQLVAQSASHCCEEAPSADVDDGEQTADSETADPTADKPLISRGCKSSISGATTAFVLLTASFLCLKKRKLH